jgi:hypothetical protein
VTAVRYPDRILSGRRNKLIALGLAAATPLLVAAVIDPVVRGAWFHDYADGRTLLGIPNALDVLSNAPFAVAGAVGLWALRRRLARASMEVVLCAAAIGLAIGSGAYHAAPRDATLLWDFLPIAVLFATLVAIVVADRIDRRAGLAAWPPLVALAVGATLWWYAGALDGRGDMRWYASVQAVGAVCVPAIALLFPGGRLRTRDLLLALGLYLGARGLAAFDAEIFAATGAVSGHTLKHLAAAAGVAVLVRAGTAGGNDAMRA